VTAKVKQTVQNTDEPENNNSIYKKSMLYSIDAPDGVAQWYSKTL